MKVLAAALALVALAPLTTGASAPVEDTIIVAGGTYFQESIYPPSDGSAWRVSAASLNGTGPFDVYIIPTTDLIDAYPSHNFQPLMAQENQSLVTFDFYAPSRIQGYTLVIDNTDNSRPTDAIPSGNITVKLTRTPPLRSSPEAQAALSAGATVCTAILAVSTVGVAIYLKRRPRHDVAGELDPDQPRAEINIEVPPPPRGAWAREAPDDAQEPEVPK